MRKTVKIVSMILVVVLLGALLASCTNVSQAYADKINDAAEKKEHITYDQVLEDLGENAIDVTFLKSGVIIAVDGCKTLEDLEDKLEAGETVKGIVVTVAAGKATAAIYKEISEEDF